MTTTMYAEPVVTLEELVLCQAMKRILARRFLDHDGTLGGGFTLAVSDAEFLQGVLAAADPNVQRDASSLLALLAKFGGVRCRCEA